MTLNWIRFSLATTYGLIVFVFFLLYLTGIITTTNLANDVLYVGFVVMIGIILNMALGVSESRGNPT
jgi:cytochrome b561